MTAKLPIPYFSFSMKKQIFRLLLLLSFTGWSQIKGIVTDEYQKPIPYVSIWVEHESSGTTSEADGSFSLAVEKNKNLVFSSLGYEQKTVQASQAERVQLKATAYQMKEIVVWNKKLTREQEIGQTESALLQTFENGARRDVKFFPYTSAYRKTRYLKEVTLFTDSGIENASIKIHLYAATEEGCPGAPLLDKDVIVTVKKGVLKHKINISEFNLVMPKTGLFAGFEKLMIESNKKEAKSLDPITQQSSVQTTYYPYVLYNTVQREYSCVFSAGKWTKQQGKTNAAGITRVFEPAINLILTN